MIGNTGDTRVLVNHVRGEAAEAARLKAEAEAAKLQAEAAELERRAAAAAEEEARRLV